MLLYNMTVGIDREIEEEWLQFIRASHIPAVMKTGMFLDVRMYKVLHDQEDGTISYSIQYFSKNIDLLNKYLQDFAPSIIGEHRHRFINRHVAFQTLLEEV